MADFHAAMTQRQDDQRRARTYGLHLIDYFPHRELGVAYYRLGSQDDAIRELETSLVSEATAKAKFYLNKARKSRLQQTGRDTSPPRIVLDAPRDGLLTNRFSVRVSGQAEDDTYVAAIAVDGQAQFIELAEPRQRFTQEVALHDGANTIDIVAHDLVGRQSRKRLTVYLDRQGPLVSLDEVEVLDTPLRVRVHGLLTDYSRIIHFVLAGRQVPLQPGTSWEFRQEVFVMPGATSLPFEVEDAAGNITQGDIALTASESALPGTRQGRPIISLLPRWAWLFPAWRSEAVVTDLPVGRTAPLQVARSRDHQPPVIKLAGLEDRETIYNDTIYLEGRVTDASAITAFAINGESLWRRNTRQLFFGQSVALQPGENALVLEATDEVGNKVQQPSWCAVRSVRLSGLVPACAWLSCLSTRRARRPCCRRWCTTTCSTSWSISGALTSSNASDSRPSCASTS
jgi:hypothetical protein